MFFFSLNLVIFWGNHQITTNKNPNANKLINYLWWGGVRPCATDLLSNASSISCLSRVQFCLVFLFVNFSFFYSGFRLLGFFPHLCTREKADDKGSTWAAGRGSLFAGCSHPRWRAVREGGRSSWGGFSLLKCLIFIGPRYTWGPIYGSESLSLTHRALVIQVIDSIQEGDRF